MIRLFAGLFLVLMTCAVQATQPKTVPPVCKGGNVLEQEKLKNPEGYALALEIARKVPNARAIFWRISKPGTDKVSHLFGTIHITDPRVINMPPKVRETLNRAKVLALELAAIGDAKQSMKGIMNNLTLAVLEPGGHLWTKLGKQKTTIVQKELLRRGIPPGPFGGVKPYVVAMMMAVPKCEMARKAAKLPVLDQRLHAIASENGTPIVGLETLREQLSAFSTMPMDAQIAFLVKTAKDGPRGADFLETMVQLYLRREMNLMFGLMHMSNEKKVADHFTTTLLRKRNHVMIKRALPLLDKGGAFIAVGALHLPGKDGLVALLRAKGFKVEPAE